MARVHSCDRLRGVRLEDDVASYWQGRRYAPSPPKLLDRVRETIRTRHYSSRTEEVYVYWIRRYIVFHQKKHPSAMGAPEISAFLTWPECAGEQRLSASTQNQALCCSSIGMS